jgi:hypothetical protein
VPQSLRLAHKAGERLRRQDARGIFGKTGSTRRRNQEIDGAQRESQSWSQRQPDP